jgi:hypothetical protein
MWCSTCQQDVSLPAAAGEGDALRCGKCGQLLVGATKTADAARSQVAEMPTSEAARPIVAARETTEALPEPSMNNSAVPAATPGGSPQAAPVFHLAIPDDWELEADLRGVERLVGSLKGNIQANSALPDGRVEWQGTPRSPAIERTNERPRSNLLAWTILSLGLATFACGAVLLGWSFAADRQDLWPLGLPLALVGQAALIVGLVLQLDGLWSSNRQTAESLTALDGELHRMRHATTLLTTTKNASAQSFYAHMAEGASPQLLLADLKGQMDLLAQQLATRR